MVRMTTFTSASRSSLGDAAGRREAVDAGHADVHQHDVGARARAARRTASSPSAASPTTVMSSWASSRARKPARTSAWSSASTTRDHELTRSDRQVGEHAEAAAGRRAGLDVAAERGGPLAHAGDAVARRGAAPPTPSSMHLDGRRRRRSATRTVAVRAPAWRVTLVSASCTIR